MTVVIVIILVVLSGMFSGLTLGFFSLNKDDLKRKADLGNVQAKRIYKVRKNGNLLLCTLLIGNVAVNATISIFLGSLTSGVLAGLTATALIVVFGEIIPQATFSRYALFFGSRLVGLVRFFIIILYPICMPMAWALDKILGDEVPTIYSKKELIKIVEEHEDSPVSDIDRDEEKILKGALSYSSKLVKNVMTPIDKVFLLSIDQVLTKEIIQKIHSIGHSRIPVFKKNKNNIIGLLYAKDLIHILEIKKVTEIMRENINIVSGDKRLDDVLNAFKKTRHHLFIVKDNKHVSGIITIEDVIEEIIGSEIIDEFDNDNMQKNKK